MATLAFMHRHKDVCRHMHDHKYQCTLRVGTLQQHSSFACMDYLFVWCATLGLCVCCVHVTELCVYTWRHCVCARDGTLCTRDGTVCVHVTALHVHVTALRVHVTALCVCGCVCVTTLCVYTCVCVHNARILMAGKISYEDRDTMLSNARKQERLIVKVCAPSPFQFLSCCVCENSPRGISCVDTCFRLRSKRQIDVTHGLMPCTQMECLMPYK